MKTNSKIAGALAGAILLVVMCVLVAFWAFGQIKRAVEVRKNAVTLLIRADDLFSALKDAETGQRGYSLTGQEFFLEPYLAVRDGIGGKLGELRRLTKLSAGQKRIDALEPLIDAELAELARVIELRRKNDMDGVVAAVSSDPGKKLMDSIRLEMRAFIQLEEAALAEREAEFQSTMRRFLAVLITGSVFALMFSLLLVYLAERESRQRLKNLVHLETTRLLGAQQEMSNQLRQANASLLVRKKELTISLKDNGDLKAALDEHAIVAMTDPQGKITFVNDRFCTISQYSRDELLGHDHRIISSGYHSKAFIRDLWATISGGRVWRGEIKNKAKDGTFYWLDSTMVPFFDEHGKIRQYISIRADITERKLAEAAVRDSEERFRTMANSMSQLAWIARPDGFLFWYNRRWYEYTGKTPEEMEGWGWQSVHDPVALPQVMINWTAAIAAGTSFEMEFPMRAADGSFRSFLTRGVPLKDDAGNVVQWFGTNTDITSLKQAEEKVRQLNADLEQRVADRTAQLEAANNELEAFSYSVAHDLRGPLRSIDGFSRLILEDFGLTLPLSGQRYLQKVRASAQTMGTLIDDLLSLAQLSRQELGKQATDTNKMVQTVLAELGSPWPDRVVKLCIADLPVSSADPGLLKQVWVNLLSNALKYSRKRVVAEIEIGCRKFNGIDTFFVRDNGTGFDMRYVHKLFGTFQRLHSADDFEGTGIGLAIVQRIILRHGGRVWAEAVVDRGATFSFTLEKETPS